MLRAPRMTAYSYMMRTTVFRASRHLRPMATEAHATQWHHGSPPLVRDPYMPALLEAQPEPSWPDNDAVEARAIIAAIMDARTFAIDRWLESQSWPPVRTTRRQIVLVDAGYDTRAYRLGLGQQARIFEVEADASLLSRKRKILSAAGRAPRAKVMDVITSASDTHACAKALLAAGFDPRVPTRWVLQGPLVEHLEAAPKVSKMLTMASAHGSAPASGVAAQVLQPAWADFLARAGMPSPPQRSSGAFGTVGETLEACHLAGWREKRTLHSSDFADMYGRVLHDAFALIFADADPEQ